MNDQPATPQKPIMPWVIWLAALLESGLIWMLHSPADQQMAGSSPDFSGAMITLILVGASILLRWGVLGFVRNSRVVFILFVCGIILALAAANLSLFSSGPFGRELFAVSVLGIVQFVPFFARQPSES
jgi:hypothetical protein